jgi:glycosyltransferase involved in cell wall biosynthesis
MSKLRILYVCHNHPDLHPGGTEIFTRDLFRAVKARGDAEAMLLACTSGLQRPRKPGTIFQAIGRSGDELLAWAGHFDRFFQSQTDLYGVVPELSELLRAFRPDVVHFHHSLLIGVEAPFLVKRVLPQARVLFTLHDYYPICANDGQMVTTAGLRCRAASPDACRRCFPKVGQDQFALREQYIKTLFSQVDRFIAPSAFLKQRYVEWGLPAERVELLRNGHGAAGGAPHRPLAPGGTRNRFGFFGHINRFKGTITQSMSRIRSGSSSRS